MDDLHEQGGRHVWSVIIFVFIGGPAALAITSHLFPRLFAPTFILLAFLPWVLRLAFSIRLRRSRLMAYRRRTHRCLSCGYSLCANLSGVCPECGTPDIA